MKVLNIILRVLLGLLILTPILGATGVFPAPIADFYTPQGWAFMSALMATGYMMPLIGLTCAAALVLVIMNKMTSAAILLAPLSVNVILFHLFLDGGVFIPDAIMGDLLFVLNAYFLYRGRKQLALK